MINTRLSIPNCFNEKTHNLHNLLIRALNFHLMGKTWHRAAALDSVKCSLKQNYWLGNVK